MKIQNFIFCWNEYVNSAFILKRMLAPFGRTTVINSNVETFRETSLPSGWINIADGYFAEQWNTMLANIDGDTDYVFHMQADAQCDADQMKILFYRFREAASQYKIGVFAPNVDYTPCVYDQKDLVKIPFASNGLSSDLKYLYEVPCTDCTCWFINRKFMDKKPLFDLSVNHVGWGADFYYTAVAALAGYKTVRDYQVTIDHPKKTTYNQDKAGEQFMKWLFTNDSEVFMEMARLICRYSSIVKIPGIVC